MKKIFLIILTAVLIVSISDVVNVRAYEPVPYWYSDSTKISSFDSNSVDFSFDVESGCDMSSNDFEDYVYHGIDAWDDELDVDFTEVTHPNGELKLRCISRSTANSYNWSVTWVGAGGISGSSFSQRYAKPNGGGTVSFYEHTGGNGYLIWDDSGVNGAVRTDGYSDNQWKNVMTHEIGHAIGFKGHNTMGSSNLMYYATTSYTTPQYYDIRHMLLVYAAE